MTALTNKCNNSIGDWDKLDSNQHLISFNVGTAEIELWSSSGWKIRKAIIFYVIFAIGAYFLAGGSRQKIMVFGFGTKGEPQEVCGDLEIARYHCEMMARLS